MEELFAAVAAGDAGRARELVRSAPALREHRGADGLLAATQALYRGDRELAAALLPPDGALNVFEAAVFGRLERLRELIAGDAECLGRFSPDGFTPLHLACYSGGAETTRLLVEHGAALETVSRHVEIRVRPLGTAAFSGDRESARVLLEAGAEPCARGEGGFAALHAAAANGDAELVRLLLDHGADPTLALPDGRTAEQLARERGHDVCADLLAAASRPT